MERGELEESWSRALTNGNRNYNELLKIVLSP